MKQEHLTHTQAWGIFCCIPSPPIQLYSIPLHISKRLIVVVWSLSPVQPRDSMDWSLPGSFVWDFTGKNIGVGCHFLLQGIVPTQGPNPGLLLWQVDSSPLSYKGSPKCWLWPTKLISRSIKWLQLQSENFALWWHCTSFGFWKTSPSRGFPGRDPRRQAEHFSSRHLASEHRAIIGFFNEKHIRPQRCN